VIVKVAFRVAGVRGDQAETVVAPAEQLVFGEINGDISGITAGDLVHWNLPGNPIDLEQREGRLTRFDGLIVRDNISTDYPIEAMNTNGKRRAGHLWKWVFEEVLRAPKGSQKHRHGLFPHWLYKPADGEQRLLRRHLLFYSQSDDVERYQRLKHELALYRLVFGQPRQQDVIKRIRESLESGKEQVDEATFARILPAYMIDLSPFEPRHAFRSAQVEAKRLLQNPKGIQELLDEVEIYRASNSSQLAPVSREIEDLTQWVKLHAENGAPDKAKQLLVALTALAYLRNPFDEVYDFFEGLGFADDFMILKDAHSGWIWAP